MKNKKMNLNKILSEGDENFEKINSLLSEAVKTSTSLDRLLEIRKQIMNLLLDKQIISNATIKSLINQYEK